MKTLKSLALGLCLLVAGSVAKANINNADDNTASPYHAINTYVDAVTRGKIAGLENVVDKTAKFNQLRGKTILSYDKAEMIKFLKENENIEQSCTVNTSIVNSNADVTVVKVDMIYPDFTRTNYLTLNNAGGSWKITNVYSVFK